MANFIHVVASDKTMSTMRMLCEKKNLSQGRTIERALSLYETIDAAYAQILVDGTINDKEVLAVVAQMLFSIVGK